MKLLYRETIHDAYSLRLETLDLPITTAHHLKTRVSDDGIPNTTPSSCIESRARPWDNCLVQLVLLHTSSYYSSLSIEKLNPLLVKYGELIRYG